LQQSPFAQQNPFWQCPLVHAWFVVQAWPFGTSAVQRPSEQCAFASQSESFRQLSLQRIDGWSGSAVQRESALAPQVSAISPLHAESSSTLLLLQIAFSQTASRRDPWH
jgi:hypothetical protein